jgi:hypothetical protein
MVSDSDNIRYSFRNGEGTSTMSWTVDSTVQHTLPANQNIYIGGTVDPKISAASFIHSTNATKYNIAYEVRNNDGSVVIGPAGTFVSVGASNANEYAIQTKLTGQEFLTQTGWMGQWVFRIIAIPIPMPTPTPEPTPEPIPTNFYLLLPGIFNNGAVSPLVANTTLFGWNIDSQFKTLGNPIYEQMHFATWAIAPRLQIGEQVVLTVMTGGGDSNNTMLSIVRNGSNTAQFIYSGSTININTILTPPTLSTMPTNMYLLPSGTFNNGAVSPLVATTDVVGWNIDFEFKHPGMNNSFYEQMYFATWAIARMLQIGEQVNITLITAWGNSNGSTLTIVRNGSDTARFIYNDTTISVYFLKYQ